ncbi:RNA-dependent RNA polymerase [Ganoderma sinense ZZ0214-1]|uniref:RNA-dependent RNA polymerase n=1 Tax=Ganoderma sinense ZZ0214-1 TaxID=1077348 RepID=A0A2G8S1I7_9APHY|nr:RNA-dependent RNA polymerase [Ganoderma sinense ZZ0214-1]
MDTVVPEGLTPLVENTAKRKRGSDDGDDSERARKYLYTSQDTDTEPVAHASLTTIVGDVSVEAVKRTDSDATAVGSNSSSQTTTSNLSTTVIRNNPVTSDSSRSHVSLPSVSSGGLAPSKACPKSLASRPPSRPAILGDSVALNVAGAAAPAAPQQHEVPHPVATLIPDASNVSAIEFQSPEPVVVAYAAHHGNYLHPLPWGVQWEIARYVNTGFDYHRFKVEFLRGLEKYGKNAAAAPEVTKFVEDERRADKVKAESEAAPSDAPAAGSGSDTADDFAAAYAREQSARLPWDELDKEDRILNDHPLGALGCNEREDYNQADPDWYGGKVHFTAKVSKDRQGNEFRFLLERPALGSSNRFMRRFGSRRFIRVRIQKDALKHGANLKEYFRRPFIVGTAVFRAFFAKEQNVFLVRTNEVVKGLVGEDLHITNPGPGERSTEMSFMDFIKWHNDLLLNSDQTMAKWAARFALGLSNSVPGLRLKRENVRFEDDIICDAFDGKGKPPSEMQMTDGCGFANRAVMRLLYEKFHTWPDEPTAIQCRIGGAKGLLLVRHDLSPDQEIEPTIWLRPSQTKIKYSALPLDRCILPDTTDPGQLTLDVLRASRLKRPARLSTETITNLAENGVPFECFRDLFQVNLRDRVDALLKWDEELADPDGPKPDGPAMKLLWDALAREGGVVAARMARADSGRARISGYVFDDGDDEFEDEDGLSQLDAALHQQSSAWWEDPISGSPSSLEETCMTLIDSGFRPESCAVLRAKLREVAKKVVKTFQTRFRFEVPMSCSAFIVPGKYMRLRFVTRHPCKVPSDVQKVTAVFHERLRHYCDVIVVSTKSHMFKGESLDRHLASLTGGGDYDGDTMEVFWDPAIVKAFHSPDPRKFAVEPPAVKTCLHKNAESVTEYLAQVPSTSPEEFKIYSLQKYLLGALQDRTLVGQYSTWWENSTYSNGYDHHDTIFLAYMFCAILDGSKTGVTVIPAKFQEHCRNQVWQVRSPAWKESMEDREREERDHHGVRKQARRPRTLPKFIMDRLRALMDESCNLQLRRIEERLPDIVAKRDDALVRPWEEACSRAVEVAASGCDLMQVELEKIKAHVHVMADKAKEAQIAAVRGLKSKSFTDLPIERRQDVLRQLSRQFHSVPAKLLFFDAASARRVKASYAYLYDYEHSNKKRWSRFPWNVGTRALCEIKAEALGFPKTIAAEFYPWMVISPSYTRKYSQT